MSAAVRKVAAWVREKRRARRLAKYHKALQAMDWHYMFKAGRAHRAGRAACTRALVLQMEVDPSGEIWMARQEAQRLGSPPARVPGATSMSASLHRRTCQQLGVCQDRPTCSDCSYPQGECQDESGDHRQALCTRLHRVTLQAAPEPDPLEAPAREHAPRVLAAFWIVYAGLLLAAGVLAFHQFGR